MSNFPTDPSAGATHAIGDKTWEYNGSAWQKIFSGDGIRAIGISGGTVSTGRSGLNFETRTTGLTLSIHSAGNTASLILDADSLAQKYAPYTYTVVSTALQVPVATSNGQFIYNDDTGKISIYKFDNNGDDFRQPLSDASGDGTSLKINMIVGNDTIPKVFEVDSQQVTYNGTKFDCASSFLQGVTAGTGKKVTIVVDQGPQHVRAQEFRFPDGTSADSIVTSFNGETGAVTTTNTVLPVAGITASSGATFSGKTNFYGLINAAGGITSSSGGTFSGKTNFYGAMDVYDNEVSRPKLKDYAETVNAIGTVTSSTVVNVENGNVQTVTVGGDCEFRFSNFPADGIAGTVTLIITNGGAHTTTWRNHGSQSVKWPGDNAPALTSSGVDIISFLTVDAGVLTYGFVGGINFS